MAKERLKVIRIPPSQSIMPDKSVFRVKSPLRRKNSQSKPRELPVDDEEFDVTVISFEEKAKVRTNLTTREERILSGSVKVRSMFEEAAEFRGKHLYDFREVEDQRAVVARMRAQACLTDGQHGNQITTNALNWGSSITSPTSIFSKGGHKEGKHGHCNSCGGDLTDGICAKKCAA